MGVGRRWAAAVLVALGLFVPPAASDVTERPKATNEAHPGLAPLMAGASRTLGIDLAHARGFDGAGRTVAVVVGGVDTTHPALAGAVVHEACFSSSGECPDDGDEDPTDAIRPGAAACTYEPGCDSGTYLTSVVAGRGGDGTMPGVAPATEVAAVRLAGTTTRDDLTTALTHLRAVHESRPLDAVLVTWGESSDVGQDCDATDPALTAAVAALRTEEVAIVVSVGGNPFDERAHTYPACMSGVTQVLAADDNSAVLWPGDGTVRLAGPTIYVRAAVPGGSRELYWTAHTGFVTGTIALLRQQDPSRPVASMVQQMIDTGAHVTTPGAQLIRRVDVAAALGLWTPQAQGMWAVTSAGRVHPRGEAPDLGGAAGLLQGESVVAGAPTNSGQGYWLATSLGRVVPRGDARHHGDMLGRPLNGPIVAMAPTPSGNGYWLLGKDGGIFTFGNAEFHGSTGNLRLNAPVTDLAPTSTGRGYWLTAMDGGVFTFGDAAFYGSTGNLVLNEPVVSIAAQPGRGYWLVALDGGVFTFGDPYFHGSLPMTNWRNQTGIRIRSSAGGRGYHIATREGYLPGFGATSLFTPYVSLQPGESVVELIVAPE